MDKFRVVEVEDTESIFTFPRPCHYTVYKDGVVQVTELWGYDAQKFVVEQMTEDDVAVVEFLDGRVRRLTRPQIMSAIQRFENARGCCSKEKP